jgi:hypothetical protein
MPYMMIPTVRAEARVTRAQTQGGVWPLLLLEGLLLMVVPLLVEPLFMSMMAGPVATVGCPRGPCVFRGSAH